jgi:pyruvate/2-oxoglutarate dehydrogenase complex dihydrolipoamide dehydrogenase (E3) component
MPDLPGADRPFVCDAWQILSGEVEPKPNAVVIGGGLIGMETADFLRERGSRVVIVEMLKRSPVSKLASHGYMLHKRLRDGGCELMLNTTVERIEEGSVLVTSEGKSEAVAPVAQVVLAVGLRAANDLKAYLKEKGVRHFVVGDAVEPRRIIEATEEGARAAWAV